MKRTLLLTTIFAISAATTLALAGNRVHTQVRTPGPGPGNDVCYYHLDVDKSAPPTAIAGSQFTYTITVTNNGPCDLRGIRVFDRLPQGVTYVSSSPTADEIPSLGGRTVAWNDVRIDSGDTATFYITVTATGSPDLVLRNRACAGGEWDGSDDRSDNDDESCGRANTTILPSPSPSPSPSESAPPIRR